MKHTKEVVVFHTLVFKLNEYFVELNKAKFKFLNHCLNWIFREKRLLNNFLNWIFLKKMIFNNPFNLGNFHIWSVSPISWLLNWIIFWIKSAEFFFNWIIFWIQSWEKQYWIEYWMNHILANFKHWIELDRVWKTPRRRWSRLKRSGKVTWSWRQRLDVMMAAVVELRLDSKSKIWKSWSSQESGKRSISRVRRKRWREANGSFF